MLFRNVIEYGYSSFFQGYGSSGLQRGVESHPVVTCGK